MVIYGGWMSVTYWHALLPTWFIVIVGAWFVAWQGSLQHECLHGHPTKWGWVNTLIALPSLAVWIPYSIYKKSHLTHHNNENLTKPEIDPESYFVTPDKWQSLPAPMKGLLVARNSLLGRFLLGPLEATIVLWSEEFRKIFRGDFENIPGILSHLAAMTGLALWLILACEMPIWFYIIAIAYPGISLSLLRSFAEHRAADDPKHRSAIVETCLPMRLLFLNNSYHVIHHNNPRLPWYKIDKLYYADRDRYLKENDGFLFRGYKEIFAKYLFKPVINPTLPS